MTVARHLTWSWLGMRAIALLFICGVTISADAQPGPPGQQSPPKRTAYELWLDEQALAATVDAARAQQAIGQVDQAVADVGEVGQDMVDILRPLGDPASRLKQIEVLRRAFRAAEATDADRTALDHLIAGRYEAAAEAFDASWREDKARGMPSLFKGIAQLELGRWGDALESLRVAEQHADCLPTATLLRAWAGRCAHAPPVDDAEAGLRFVQALSDLPPREIGMENAVARKLYYNESDALYWAQGATYNLRHHRIKELLAESQTTQDPQRATVLWVAFGRVGNIEDALTLHTQRFPDDAPTRRHLALMRLQGLWDEALREAWPGVQRLIDEAQADDPGNGYYDLMRVLPINEHEEVELADGVTDYVDVSEPFTDAEIAALRRAADAERFEHPGDTIRRQVYVVLNEELGAFSELSEHSRLGLRLSDFRSILGRYDNSYKAMVEAGREDEAIELAKTLQRLSRSMLPEWEPHPAMRLLSSVGGADSYVHNAWMDRAETIHDAGLMRAGVASVVRQCRRRDFIRTILDPIMLAHVLPVQRMRTAVAQLAQAGKSADSPIFLAVSRLGLEQHRDKADKWTAELRADLTDGDGRLHNDYAVIRLVDLRHAAVLPLINTMRDSDDLYTVRFARWAEDEIIRHANEWE